MHFTLKALQEMTQAKLFGDPAALIDGVAGLAAAKPTDLSFLENDKYRSALAATQAGAVIIKSEDEVAPGKNYLVHPQPSKAFQTVLEAFAKGKRKRTSFQGIHPTAVIHPEAQVGQGVTVAPYVVIEAGATIGDGTYLGAHVYVGCDTHIGADCVIYPNVTIREEVVLGNRVILQPGCVIGSCGFGYLPDALGHHKKLEHVGMVEIEDDVEIGANTTIDRARFDKTILRKGTKIDNLVQIGHNVEVGEHCCLVSQVGIAGSAKLGNYVMLGGKVGVNGHIEIGNQVMVGACSAVSKNLEAPGKYVGLPAESASNYFRIMAAQRKLPALLKKFSKLLPLLDSIDTSKT